MATSRAQAGRLAVWSAFLALTLRLLHGATFGQLSVPLGSLDELAAWADHTSPTVMALAVLRLAALVAAWYLTIATILAVVADIAGWRRMGAIVAALSPGIVRRVAARAAGVGLAAGAVLAVAPLPSRLLAAPASASASPTAEPSERAPTRRPDGADPPTATMAVTSPRVTAMRSPGIDPRRDTTDRPPRATMSPPVGPFTPLDQETATMTRLPGRGTSSVATMTQLAWSSEPPPATSSSPIGAPASVAEADAATEPGAAGDSWTVTGGDSFWSIARDVLAETTGRSPREHDVRRYWLHLIEANRSRLADPANPDLLIPGQRLHLPAPA